VPETRWLSLARYLAGKKLEERQAFEAYAEFVLGVSVELVGTARVLKALSMFGV